MKLGSGNSNKFNYEVYWKVFHHLKYICMKPATLEVLARKERIFYKIAQILYEINYLAAFQLRTSMVNYDDINHEIRIMEVEIMA